MKPPLLTSARLTLDAFTEDDTDAVLAHVDDGELQRYVPVPVPYTRTDAEHYTGSYMQMAEPNPGIAVWAVRLDGQLAGALELRMAELYDGDIGFWVGRPFRGQGVMTEAVGLVVDHAFGPLGLHRVSWATVAGNVGSARVVQRNGFTFEGLRRLGLQHRDERVDSWVASLLRGDPRRPTDGWPV